MLSDIDQWVIDFIADAESRYGPVWENAEDAVAATTLFIDENPHIVEMDVGVAVDYWYMFQI